MTQLYPCQEIGALAREMGITATVTRIPTPVHYRADDHGALRQDRGPTYAYACTLRRADAKFLHVFMWGNPQAPTLGRVLHDIFMRIYDIEDVNFRGWLENLGYDPELLTFGQLRAMLRDYKAAERSQDGMTDFLGGDAAYERMYDCVADNA